MTEDRAQSTACRFHDANVDVRVLSIPLWFVTRSLTTLLEFCRPETLCDAIKGRIRDDSYAQQYWRLYASAECGYLAPERVRRAVPSGRGGGKEPGLDTRG